MVTSAPPLRSLRRSQIKAAVQSQRGMLVDCMIQEQTVNIIVGDSGIGKSPLLQQLGLSVALGRSFLGLSTRQANVLSIDYENPSSELDKIIDRLATFLDIGDFDPESFRTLHYPESKAAIEMEIRAFKPELIIVDALRGLDPKAEKDAEAAMLLLDWLHKKAEKYHTSFLILHHTRKPDQKDPPAKLNVLNQSVLTWLLQASGSRALINQTEARFAVEECSLENAALIMRGHIKLTGEVGPWYIERVYAPEVEDPLGYRRLSSESLLKQADKEKLQKLPLRFTWPEAEATMGVKRGKALSRLISIFRAAGLISHHGTGKNVYYTRNSSPHTLI